MNDLRDLFHRLRDEEHAPPFRSAAARPPLSKRRLRAALRYAVVIIVVVLGIVAFHHRRPPVTESIVTWKAPTDFLLRTPGSELLSTVPQIPERR
jgi:hypothetical protein